MARRACTEHWRDEPEERDAPAAELPPLLGGDGCHRICAGHHLDEDADVPCRMVDLP